MVLSLFKRQKTSLLLRRITNARNLHAVSPQPGPKSIVRNASQTNEGRPSGAPLSLLPLSNLFRSFVVTALSSHPTLLAPSLRLLSFLANSSSPLLNPDRNLLLRILLRKTFYAQFCAGETTQEVKDTVQSLKRLGFEGVILSYAKEIVLECGEQLALSSISTSTPSEPAGINALKEVQAWKVGTIKTVEMTEPGDFVALKFSGAGRDVMCQLAIKSPPSKPIDQATVEICELANMRGVRLLCDAEQNTIQEGIDAWTLKLQERYNRDRAVVYGTYQAYLRSTPTILARDLATARKKGFVLGVKLVRGAYMASDPRKLFWRTKEETDKTYDGIAEALMKRQWNPVLSSAEPITTFPDVDLVLATHNTESIKKARTIQRDQTMKREARIEMAYGQLMGMADEVSCDLVLTHNRNRNLDNAGFVVDTGPYAYKYLVWGSVGECLKYLVRRAEENRDAVLRAKASRFALKKEILRRLLTWTR